MEIVPMMGWKSHACSKAQTTINTLDVVVEAFQQTREIQRQCTSRTEKNATIREKNRQLPAVT